MWRERRVEKFNGVVFIFVVVLEKELEGEGLGMVL